MKDRELIDVETIFSNIEFNYLLLILIKNNSNGNSVGVIFLYTVVH